MKKIDLNKGILIAPSLLSADFADFGMEAERAHEAGADMLHLDVMDGHFVPNITFGAPLIKAVRPRTNAVFDVHLMISDPLFYLSDFASAGADIITIHTECDNDPFLILKEIRERGILAGISLKPGTKAETIFPFLPFADMVLVMTVEPGFGGQSFMTEMLPKISDIKEYITRNGLSAAIQVDGGISTETAPSAARAGATIFVAGSSVYSAANLSKGIRELRYSVNALF